MFWTTTEHKLSPEQKGFMPFEGCLEHNFTLQSAIQDTKSNRRECAVTWLDLTNAFGSVPHTTIWDALSSKGLSPGTVTRIAEMYRDNRTTYLTQAWLTSEVPISKGVRQGCPLSPIVFNFAIDSMVAKAGACAKDNGYWMYGTGISVLSYADDLVVVGKSEKDLHLILKGVCDEAQRLGLSFNPKKCASLHVSGKKHDALATRFEVQGSQVPVLGKEDYYRHLGVPTGYRSLVSVTNYVDKMIEDLDKVDKSFLAPWQKLAAVNTFLSTRLQFLLKSGYVGKADLQRYDDKVVEVARKWTGITQRGSREIMYLTPRHGGFGLFPTDVMAEVSVIAQATKYLWSKEKLLSQLAQGFLHATVLKRTGSADNSDQSRFLNAESKDKHNEGKNLWSRTRTLTTTLKSKLSGFQWTGRDTPVPTLRGRVLTPQTTEKELKSAFREIQLQLLLAKPDQGKVMAHSSLNAVSNHFVWKGQYVRYADWRFVFKARLNTIGLNGNNRWDASKDPKCRHCGYEQESLPHVVSSCPRS